MPRIVHLGFGNFHRAHQAWYTQLSNDLGGTQWAITGVSMSRPDLRDALSPDGFSYSLGLRGVDGLRVQAITVHDRLLVAREDPQSVIREIAEPETKILSLTVTEKGYGLNADGRLNLDDPVIQADFNSDSPKSSVGILAHGLKLRSKINEPITVMSCDNLSGNGQLLRQAVMDFAQAAGWNMSEYLESRVTFPDTMVDRITPATTDMTREEIADVTGRREPVPVITETFSEWVIEDHFAAGRPDWDAVGAVFSKEVAPFEARKLRLLNASHSLLAYGGVLRGHDFVHEAISDPVLRDHVESLWAEAIETLPVSIQESCKAYCDALVARFEVPAIRHELRQIAADGTLKLPVRIFGTATDRKADGSESPALSLAVGSWLAFCHKNAITADPRANEINALLFKREPEQGLYRKVLRDMNWVGTCPFEAQELVESAQSWLHA